MAEWTRFVIPVPTRDLRAHLEAERARRARQPLHPRESEDAPPDVLHDLWRQLVMVALTLGLVGDEVRRAGDVPYDPLIYQRVYEHLLVHRRAEAVALDTRLPTADFTPYRFEIPTVDVVPSPAEASRAIHDMQARYPDVGDLQEAIERWYRTA